MASPVQRKDSYDIFTDYANDGNLKYLLRLMQNALEWMNFAAPCLENRDIVDVTAFGHGTRGMEGPLYAASLLPDISKLSDSVTQLAGEGSLWDRVHPVTMKFAGVLADVTNIAKWSHSVQAVNLGANLPVVETVKHLSYIWIFSNKSLNDMEKYTELVDKNCTADHKELQQSAHIWGFTRNFSILALSAIALSGMAFNSTAMLALSSASLIGGLKEYFALAELKQVDA